MSANSPFIVLHISAPSLRSEAAPAWMVFDKGLSNGVLSDNSRKTELPVSDLRLSMTDKVATICANITSYLHGSPAARALARARRSPSIRPPPMQVLLAGHVDHRASR